MPTRKPSELQVGCGGLWPTTGWPSERWGDMVVGLTTVPGPADCTELYRGLPGKPTPVPAARSKRLSGERPVIFHTETN